MNKKLKKCLILGIAAGLSLQLAACGGKNASNSSQTSLENQGNFYTAKYTTLPEGTNADNVCFSGSTLYYVSSESTETAYTSFIYSAELDNPNPQKLPITFQENEYVTTLAGGTDGSLYLLTNVNNYNEENPEASTQEYSLKQMKPDGTLVNTISLSPFLESEEDSYVQYLLLDNDGNIVFTNGQTKIWVLNPEGTLLFTLDVDNWINSMGVSKEGKILVAVYGQNGMELKDIDLEAKAFGTTYELPEFNGGINSIGKSQKNGILFNTGNLLLQYDLEKKELSTLLSWLDNDINGDEVRFFTELEDGKLLAVSTSYETEASSSDLILLTQADASQITEKTVITYGATYTDYNVKKEIINFNKTNPKYRVKVKDYASEGDYEAAITKMNSEILSGTGPDIFDFSAGISLTAYANKGVLEDLYPYLESDTELNKEDFLENVLHAFEVDGKLYMMAPSFYINTVIGKTSQVGSEMGWTMQELMDLYKTLPPDTELFDFGSKSTILSYTCMNDISQFIDWKTGTCSFNTDAFLNALEFANTFPKEFNYDEDGPSTPSKIRSGKLVLLNTSINDVKQYQMYKAMFNEPMTFIGFPASSGTGSYLYPNNPMGINAKSKNKEGAWEFIRTFLTKEYQELDKNGQNKIWGFVTRKNELDAYLQQSTVPEYYTDENGQQIEQTSSYGYNDFDIEIKAATQEDVQEIKKLIESVDSVSNQDQQITKIVAEESEAYFNGAKTAKEVADIIQNRVQIYVNESR